MLQSPRRGARGKRALLATAVAALGAAGLMGQAALASPVTAPDVPASIAVPAGNVPYLVGHATGTQNYTCQSDGTWGPATPEAILTKPGNEHVFIAHHFAGPTWQAKDGSFVKAARDGSAPGGAGNIAWLRLKTTQTGTGPDGGARLTATTYIQRINTVGGVAPAGACTPGDTASVPYQADYYFYRAK